MIVADASASSSAAAGNCGPDDNADDCTELTAFAASTNVAQVSNWTMDGKTSICDWEGVECASSVYLGRPSQIKINSKGVKGFLPTEIGLLNGLIQLDLWDNSLSGTVPTTIGNLNPDELVGIYMGDNWGLTGPIPEEISKLTDLADLDLYDTALTKMPSVICDMLAAGKMTDCHLQNVPFACPLPPCASKCSATCK